ncbi:MAG: hypothetical protein GXX91_03330 [Verrucomicrobiaceae bacterium]|nr:hypothetical protein [Verrucomicrobiaceae bacterium]
MDLSIDLKLTDGRTLKGSLPFSTMWTMPSVAQVKSMQTELAGLLTKLSSGSPLLTTRLEFSARLNETENNRLSGLLQEPLVSDSLTLQQVLAAVKQRQMDGNFVCGPLMDLVKRRWADDPTMLAFFLEALATRGEEAIVDLYLPSPGIWDDSFIEPIVKLAEKSSKYQVSVSAHKRMITLHRCLDVLDRNRGSWAKDPTISPRLSKAVLRGYPILTGYRAENLDDRGRNPAGTESQEFYVALDSITLTRDAAMIPILRPFLRETKLNAYTVNSSQPGMIPMRVCDIAANAISQILGGAEIITGSRIPVLSSNPPESRPNDPMSWSRRDHLIAELERKLDLPTSR